MTDNEDGSGFGEGAQRAFALDDAVAFRSLMLDIYSHSCALTGGALNAGPDDGLDVFLLQPLSHGGSMTPGNALVVDKAAARLLEQGLVLVDDDYVAFLPHPEIAGPPFDSGSSSGRQLHLPESVSLWPDRAMLAYHRSRFRTQ